MGRYGPLSLQLTNKNLNRKLLPIFKKILKVRRKGANFAYTKGTDFV